MDLWMHQLYSFKITGHWLQSKPRSFLYECYAWITLLIMQCLCLSQWVSYQMITMLSAWLVVWSEQSSSQSDWCDMMWSTFMLDPDQRTATHRHFFFPRMWPPENNWKYCLYSGYFYCSVVWVPHESTSLDFYFDRCSLFCCCTREHSPVFYVLCRSFLH